MRLSPAQLVACFAGGDAEAFGHHTQALFFQPGRQKDGATLAGQQLDGVDQDGQQRSADQAGLWPRHGGNLLMLFQFLQGHQRPSAGLGTPFIDRQIAGHTQ